ncbi:MULTISPECIES: NAD(P)-dependent oxidoreductase [unclassified Caulobacter]|uniref:NAD-dependent epimerase/dehydratase family protein n=1 Tax=unclassified Caulobacter TaxID=2648921 RepID=UPI000784BD5E|nr:MULTISPECIES: NAD-dependent epimerase/dehydratase family protein [unclassified Caulobacter]AZS19702.1 NAD-dependent epimerase/dehydratase family protein [Caulobacter sp. FWC26]
MDAENTLKTPVLVLGATSLIGRHLMARLKEEGLDPIAFSRRPPPGDACWVGGDLKDPDLAERLPVATTVFSLSPIWLLPSALRALEARGMARLIAFSSTSRFTKTDSPVAAERAVAAALAEAEQAIEAWCAANGVAWTILRPTLIYDEGHDENVSRIARLVRRFHVMPLSGAGEGLRQPVHAEDLAAGALAAAHAPAAQNRTYNLVGGETVSYRVMVDRVFEGLGKTPRTLPMPTWLFGLLMRLAKPFYPGATTAMGTRMGQDLTFDSSDAARDFGWSPRRFHPRF